MKVVGKILKDAAEGDYGPVAKKLYWFAFNHAAWIGFVFFALDGALLGAQKFGLCTEAFDCATLDGYVRYAWETLGSLGFATTLHNSAAPGDRRENVASDLGPSDRRTDPKA